MADGALTRPFNTTDLRRAYAGKTIVIKFGGALAEDDAVIAGIGRQAGFLARAAAANVIVVHGGGRQIDDALAQAGLAPRRDAATGLRITDLATLDISDAALRRLNKHIVSLFRQSAFGAEIVGEAAYDGPAVRARAVAQFTGEVTHVDAGYLRRLSRGAPSRLPVLYPVSRNEQPSTAGGRAETRLNVNADDVAASIAAAMGAARLILCSDVPGVRGADGKVLPRLSTDDVQTLIRSGVVTGGMIAKLQAAAAASQHLAEGGTVILDGRRPNAILDSLAGKNDAGTLVFPARFIPRPGPAAR